MCRNCSFVSRMGCCWRQVTVRLHACSSTDTILGSGNFEGIQGSTALSCLLSMPFRPDLASKFIDEYLKLLQFHSTVDILKRMCPSSSPLRSRVMHAYWSDPPPSYPSPSIDLFAGFDNIRHKVASGFYTSQFMFDSDINSLLEAAHDDHLQLGLCSQEIFHFWNNLPLVSASDDASQLPRIYTHCKFLRQIWRHFGLTHSPQPGSRCRAEIKWR